MTAHHIITTKKRRKNHHQSSKGTAQKNTCFGQRTWDLSELFVSEKSWGLYKSLHQKPATIQIFVSTQLCSTCDGHWIGKDQPLHLLHSCHDQISIGSALIVGRPGNDDSWLKGDSFCTNLENNDVLKYVHLSLSGSFYLIKLKMPSCGDLLDSWFGALEIGECKICQLWHMEVCQGASLYQCQQHYDYKVWGVSRVFQKHLQ